MDNYDESVTILGQLWWKWHYWDNYNESHIIGTIMIRVTVILFGWKWCDNIGTIMMKVTILGRI